jgi:hypothetical protein
VQPNPSDLRSSSSFLTRNDLKKLFIYCNRYDSFFASNKSPRCFRV